MKRLKYICPFGGKQYPLFLAAISVLVPLFGLLFSDITPYFRMLMMFACPLAVLTACFFWEQSLTDDEREICNSCAMPLWLPANPALAEAVRKRTGYPNRYTFSVGLICLFFSVSFLVPVAGTTGAVPTAAACCMAPGAVFIVLQLIHTYLWSTVDETTVYTIIPIDHMYDVRHTGKNGNVWYESYLVFYQPDGRYTLHARKGDGNANAVVIVKHRGLVTWLPYKEERY